VTLQGSVIGQVEAEKSAEKRTKGGRCADSLGTGIIKVWWNPGFLTETEMVKVVKKKTPERRKGRKGSRVEKQTALQNQRMTKKNGRKIRRHKKARKAMGQTYRSKESSLGDETSSKKKDQTDSPITGK